MLFVYLSSWITRSGFARSKGNPSVILVMCTSFTWQGLSTLPTSKQVVNVSLSITSPLHCCHIFLESGRWEVLSVRQISLRERLEVFSCEMPLVHFLNWIGFVFFPQFLEALLNPSPFSISLLTLLGVLFIWHREAFYFISSPLTLAFSFEASGFWVIRNFDFYLYLWGDS